MPTVPEQMCMCDVHKSEKTGQPKKCELPCDHRDLANVPSGGQSAYRNMGCRALSKGREWAEVGWQDKGGLGKNIHVSMLSSPFEAAGIGLGVAQGESGAGDVELGLSMSSVFVCTSTKAIFERVLSL